MLRLRVRYEGLKLKGKEFIEEAREQTYEFAKEIVEDLRKYPPVPPEPNKYVRTYTLYNSWEVSRPFRRGDIFTVDFGILSGQPEYWKYVQGPSNYQREYHRDHGWKSIEDADSYRYDFYYGKILDLTLRKIWRYL